MKRNRLRKALSLLLIVNIALFFTACGEIDNSAGHTDSTSQQSSSTPEITTLINHDDTVTYSKQADGLILEVTVPKTILYGQRFLCTAKITNTTNEVIHYYIPVYDENAHKQIQVKIGATNYEFIDCDTFGKGYAAAMMALEIKAHDSFVEQIDFLPGYRTGGSWQELNKAEITFFQPGNYDGNAQFVWTIGSGTGDLSLDFTVTIE